MVEPSASKSGNIIFLRRVIPAPSCRPALVAYRRGSNAGKRERLDRQSPRVEAARVGVVGGGGTARRGCSRPVEAQGAAKRPAPFPPRGTFARPRGSGSI